MDLARAGVSCDYRSVYTRSVCTRCHQRPAPSWTLRHPAPPADAGERPVRSASTEANRVNQVSEAPVLAFSSDSAVLDANERPPGSCALRHGKGQPVRLPLHAGVLPGLQPFQSRDFRRAHHRRSLQQRRWASLNLSAALIRSSHACCAACTPASPCMPAVHAPELNDADGPSHAPSGAAAPPPDAALALADAAEPTHAMRGSISFSRNLVGMGDGADGADAAAVDAPPPSPRGAALPVIRVRRDDAAAAPPCPALAPQAVRPAEGWSAVPRPVRVAAAVRALPFGAARAASFPPRLTVSGAARHFRPAGAAAPRMAVALPPLSARSSPPPCASADSLANTELLGQVLSSFSMASPTGASVDGSGVLMSDASSEPDIVVVKQPHDIFLSPRAAHSAPGLGATPRLASPPPAACAFARPSACADGLGGSSYDSDSSCSCESALAVASPRSADGVGAFAPYGGSAMLLDTPERSAPALEDPWSVASSTSLLMRSLTASTPASVFSPAADNVRGADWGRRSGGAPGLPLAATVVCENPLFESALARARHAHNAIALAGGTSGIVSLPHAVTVPGAVTVPLFSTARELSVSSDHDRLSAQSAYTAGGGAAGSPLSDAEGSAAMMEFESSADGVDRRHAALPLAAVESSPDVGASSPGIEAAEGDEAEGPSLLDALRRASMDSQRLLSPRVDADGLCGDWELV